MEKLANTANDKTKLLFLLLHFDIVQQNYDQYLSHMLHVDVAPK